MISVKERGISVAERGGATQKTKERKGGEWQRDGIRETGGSEAEDDTGGEEAVDRVETCRTLLPVKL